MVRNAAFGVGKLPMQHLQALLARYAGSDERLVVGPRVGEDAAVLDMGDRYLVLKSDPITFATDEIGWYVVHVNANDIAAMGATPRWLLLTLLLPEGRTDADLVESIFRQVSETGQQLGIVLCGGHTEITHGLDRPIVVGLMAGEVEKDNLVCTAGARAGDQILLTKGIAIEGTALIAFELGSRLEHSIAPELVQRGRRFLKDPGISVLNDARIVCQAGRPHAMHDPTEGGLATGLWELAQASGQGIVVYQEQIYVFPETRAFCDVLELDPLGLLASGALVVTASPADVRSMQRDLTAGGIDSEIIGEVVDGPPDVQVRTDRGLESLPAFERDELAHLFETTVPRTS